MRWLSFLLFMILKATLIALLLPSISDMLSFFWVRYLPNDSFLDSSFLPSRGIGISLSSSSLRRLGRVPPSPLIGHSKKPYSLKKAWTKSPQADCSGLPLRRTSSKFCRKAPPRSMHSRSPPMIADHASKLGSGLPFHSGLPASIQY